jgi:hypothetical protein
MIVGVFFLGASYAYKLVFAVWLVPWLRQTPAEPGERRWRGATALLLLAVLWLEGLAAIVLNLTAAPDSTRALAVLRAVLVVEELVDWAFVACLMRFLFVHAGRWGRTFVAGTAARA